MTGNETMALLLIALGALGYFAAEWLRHRTGVHRFEDIADQLLREEVRT